MSTVNLWWPLYVGDFAIDTAHLSNEEVGAYIRILNVAWHSGGALRNDPKCLAKLVGVSPQKWRGIQPALDDKFAKQDGKIIPLILVEPLKKAIATSEKNRANSNKRWSGKDGGKDDGDEMRWQCDRNANGMQAKAIAIVSTCSNGAGSTTIAPLNEQRRPA